ncbi:MAG: hypothetical protein KA163_02375 [Bacteroidia bacterium]|nr:hypothetical protein [Bacteroidia bacterium]
MRRIKFIILIILLAFCEVSFSQIYPVQLSAQLIPPYSGYLPDYADPSSEKLKIILQFNDFLTPQYNVRLRIEIKGNGFTLVTKQLFNPPPINLQSGVPLLLSGADLAPYLNSNNLDFIGINQSQYEQRMALPEGYYSVCVKAYDYYNPGNIQVSNESCSQAWFTLSDPPFLNLPQCGKNVTPQTPQNILFQWTPMHMSSPNSAANTEYEFALWEVRPDSSANPNQVVLSTAPIFSTTTNLTLLNYGIAEPPLNIYMKYVWRVRAKDITGRDWFKNSGYSQICTFVYGDLQSVLGNALNLTLSAEGITHRLGKCTWNTQNIYTKYLLQVRKTGTQNWFDYNCTTGFEKINNLEPNTTYEARVRGEGSITGDWSNTATFNTNSEPNYSCNDQTQYADALAAQPLPAHKAISGLIIQTGQFEVITTQINPSGPPGWYSGKGYAKVFGALPLAVQFNKIFIDDNNRHQQGVIQALTKGITNWLHEWDVKDAEEHATYVNGNIDSIKIVGNQICVKIQGKISDSCFAFPPNQNVVVVRDDNGNQWTVTVNPPPPTITGPTNYNQYSNDELDASDSTLVVFEKSPAQVYGFDEKKYTAWTNNYELIKLRNGKNYFVPYKSVKEFSNDEVYAKIDIKGFVASKLSFKTDNSFELTKTEVNSTIYKISVPYQYRSVYAWYDGKKVGKLNVVNLKTISKKLVIVPVGNANISTTNLQADLNKIFQQANVTWNVTAKPAFTFNLGNDGLKSADATLMSKYSEEMRALRDAYKQATPDYDKEAYYVFVVSNFDEPSLKGYMVRGRALGFVTSSASTKEIAHELAHGAFGLEHTFPAIGKNTSQNLLDYGTGTELGKVQWEEMQSPILNPLLSWDDGEEDGSYQVCNPEVAELARGVLVTKLNECKTVCTSGSFCLKRDHFATYVNNVCAQALANLSNEERWDAITCIAGGYGYSNLHWTQEEPILRLIRTMPSTKVNCDYLVQSLESNNFSLLQKLRTGIDGSNYTDLISLITNAVVKSKSFDANQPIDLDSKIFKWNGSNSGINFTLQFNQQGLLAAVIHTNASMGYKEVTFKPFDYVGILSKVSLPGIKTSYNGKYYAAIVPGIYLQWMYDKAGTESAIKFTFNAASVLTLQGGIGIALNSANVLTKVFGILEITSGISSLVLDNTTIENKIVTKYGASGQTFVDNIRFCLNMYNLASGTGQLVKLTTSYAGAKNFWKTNKQQIKNENLVNQSEFSKFDEFLDEVSIGGRFIAKSGPELKAYLDKLIDKPIGKSYTGDFYRSLSKNSELNFGATPKKITPHDEFSTWGRYDLDGEENAMYLSKTLQGNQTELSVYGAWTDFNTYKFTNVTANNLLDLSDDAVRMKLGTQFDDLVKTLGEKKDMYDIPNELASWARKKGYNGIIAPGARGAKNYDNIVLFNQSYTDQLLQGITPQKLPK